MTGPRRNEILKEGTLPKAPAEAERPRRLIERAWSGADWVRRINSSSKLRGAGAPITEGESQRDIARRDATFRHTLALADFFAAGFALVLCVSVASDDRLRWTALLALPLVVVASKLNGLYDRDELLIHKTTIDEAPRLLQLATLYTLLIVLLQDTLIEGHLGSLQIIVLWASLFASAVLARRLARSVARATSAVERCLFVGSDASYERLHAKLQGSACSVVVVGRMSLEDPDEEDTEEHTMSVFSSLVQQLNVHRVIVEPSEASPDLTLDFVRVAKASGVRVSLLPRLLEAVGSSVDFEDLDGMTVLGVRSFGLSRSSRALKRCFDLAGAGLGVIAVSPLLLVLALAVKLGSRGPVFFRQERVGKDGERFGMIKFRSMVVDAEAMKDQLRDRNETEGLFKIANDPRITRVGRLLRASSLDELPQLSQRPSRRDEPRRPAPAGARGGRAGQRPGPLAPGADPRHDGAVADPRARPGAAARDGLDRLPLRRQLVAVARRRDPRAHGAVHASGAAANSRSRCVRCLAPNVVRQSLGSVSGSVRSAHSRYVRAPVFSLPDRVRAKM